MLKLLSFLKNSPHIFVIFVCLVCVVVLVLAQVNLIDKKGIADDIAAQVLERITGVKVQLPE